MPTKFDNILGTIGRTPVVRLAKLAPPRVRLYVKVEAFNPMGSVKDRLALGIIEDAERRGTLTPGKTVIEATSGELFAHTAKAHFSRDLISPRPATPRKPRSTVRPAGKKAPSPTRR